MDSDKAWEEAVEYAEALINEKEHYGDDHDKAVVEMLLDGQELAERVVALRDWLKQGGFPPKAFTADRDKTWK